MCVSSLNFFNSNSRFIIFANYIKADKDEIYLVALGIGRERQCCLGSKKITVPRILKAWNCDASRIDKYLDQPAQFTLVKDIADFVSVLNKQIEKTVTKLIF